LYYKYSNTKLHRILIARANMMGWML
jgi:hypothetical protein